MCKSISPRLLDWSGSGMEKRSRLQVHSHSYRVSDPTVMRYRSEAVQAIHLYSSCLAVMGA